MSFNLEKIFITRILIAFFIIVITCNESIIASIAKGNSYNTVTENFEETRCSEVACPTEYTITYPDLVCVGDPISVEVDVVGATTPLDIVIGDGTNFYGIVAGVTSFPVSIELGDPDWAFVNPCTSEQISHAQKVTFVDCAPSVLENDFIEIRAGDINEVNLFENDFNPDRFSTQIIEIEREELFSAYDFDSAGIFNFVIKQSFFVTLNVTYEVCNLECDNCISAILKIVDEALKDIFLTDIITPDGDGMNDALKFNFDEEISDAHIYIFNRWGSKVYEKIGYTNDWDASGYPG